MSDHNGQKFHYCVLYTRALKQYDLYRVIRQSMPEGRGTVFYPCAELWWNKTVDTVIRPLFPGYVFIRSDMNREELHELLKSRRQEVLSFIKELKLTERKAGGDPLYDMEEEKEILLDLKDDEAEFFDFLLNFKYEPLEKDKDTDAARDAGESIDNRDGDRYSRSKDADDDSADEDFSKGRMRTRRIPKEGVIGMSRGYRENGRYVVMEGPLKGHEQRIVDVDLRKRKAYLNIKINGHIAKAGLEIYGKRYWYPQDEHAADILDDGTEVNPVGIADSMMGRAISTL